jgi:hypothetical protein
VVQRHVQTVPDLVGQPVHIAQEMAADIGFGLGVANIETPVCVHFFPHYFPFRPWSGYGKSPPNRDLSCSDRSVLMRAHKGSPWNHRRRERGTRSRLARYSLGNCSWGRIMEIVLLIVFPVIFFYVLYGVIRAATRDGIIAVKQAERHSATADADSLGR